MAKDDQGTVKPGIKTSEHFWVAVAIVATILAAIAKHVSPDVAAVLVNLEAALYALIRWRSKAGR